MTSVGGSLSIYARLQRSRLFNQALQLRIGHDPRDLLGIAVEALLSQREGVRIVQVGANDGVHNDALHGLARQYPDRTHLLLIEPQNSLIPILSQTYTWHPDVTVCVAAVGAAGESDLYGVAPEHWSSCQPNYAADWPAYRAPTGVASQSRQHVVQWARRYYRGDRDVSDLVVTQRVRSMPLPDVLADVRWPRDFDILQIDAEGLDDEVIYHSGLDESTPPVINFEHCHLDRARSDALDRYLRSFGYSLHTHGDNTLAIRSQRVRNLTRD